MPSSPQVASTIFLGAAAQVAVDAVLYLWAYAMVPLLAWLTAMAIRWFIGRQYWLAYAPRSWPATFLVAVGRYPGWREVFQSLCVLHDQGRKTCFFLIASHNLLVSFYFLVGPLLGKDVLLSLLIGTGIYLGLAIPICDKAGFQAEIVCSSGESAISRPALRESALYFGWAAYGLLLGSLVAAWGLTSPGFAPVEISQSPFFAQMLNSLIGLLAAVATFMSPVAALFTGTYLWKIGLAHAGLITFFCATTLTPQRWMLYRRVYGRNQARGLYLGLAAAALLSGILTALLYAATDALDIGYKLIPQQMLRF